ncbi:MAG TPA: transcription antitermination factor NusB [Xanthobacteraceae bacterium]|nr:transcription antitermination factor NusB [Xanthobacteraceae bacterium]
MPPPVPGLAVRRIAAEIIDGVLRRKRTLDEQLDDQVALRAFSERDRALLRRLVATVLRRLGTLRHLLGSMLERGLPHDAPHVESVLLVGAAQILFLDVPDHAAVDLAVRLVQSDRRAARYSGLVNAVLRRLAREGKNRLAPLDAVKLDTPEWLMRRWTSNYGAATARAIAIANAQEPPLDLSPKGDPQTLAARLGGRVLATGSVRLIAHGPISQLAGFAEGDWWVQDAAAALPARLLGDVRGRQVADLCAAPGGKTAQLATAGARVVAVDRSAVRLERLRENLARLKLDAETVAADATQWQGGLFDAVLLDAPCSSTGTIRRHPDVPWIKSEADLPALVELQRALLDHAVTLLKPDGLLVYCTCSLEPEENEHAIASLLSRNPGLRRRPIGADEVGGLAELITPAGDLRTLPSYLPDSDPRASGMDGFYAARIEKKE